MTTTRIVTLRCHDFDDPTQRATLELQQSERIVSVELGSRPPLRVWVETTEPPTITGLADRRPAVEALATELISHLTLISMGLSDETRTLTRDECVRLAAVLDYLLSQLPPNDAIDET